MAQGPPEPPRLVSEPDQDIVAIANWASDFYRVTVLEGFFAATEEVSAALNSLASGEPVDLDNLPDPESASVQSAQIVANAAFTLAAMRTFGEAVVFEDATSVVVTLPEAEEDANYGVVACAVAEAGAPAANAHIITSIAKTATDFTINVLAAPGLAAGGDSVTFQWIRIRN